MLSASSWSWVTKMNVIPTSSCSAFSSSRSWLADFRVERAERLVEQQHGRAQDQRPGQRDALLLAAGELVRAALAELAELDQLERLLDAPVALAARDLLVAQAEGDVVEHVEVREQRVALEDGVDVAPLAAAPAARSVPSSRISPAVGRSKPAIIRSVVVLPQPDGPSSEKNSPAAIVEVDPVDRDVTSSKRLVRPQRARTVAPWRHATARLRIASSVSTAVRSASPRRASRTRCGGRTSAERGRRRRPRSAW